MKWLRGRVFRSVRGLKEDALGVYPFIHGSVAIELSTASADWSDEARL